MEQIPEKTLFEKVWDRICRTLKWNRASQMADFLEISKSTISQCRKRGTFPTEWAFRIAQGNNLSTDWLLTGKGQPYIIKEMTDNPLLLNSTSSRSSDNYDYIPMVETTLSAGGGAFVQSEGVEGYYAFRKSWIKRVSSSTKDLVLMRITGDSMSPTIQDRDTVMIDIGRKNIKEGSVYAIRLDSTVLIKRLAFRPGDKFLIISDNKNDYQPYEVSSSELKVIGQVIFFSRVLVPDGL